MTPNSQTIAALLGSRICHDLISPLGAISNGVELLQMAGGSLGPEVALISESVENANARIRFFRVAYGAAHDGQTIAAAEIRNVLADLGSGSRLQVDWQIDGDAPRQRAKQAFLAIQCLETAMPWGGNVTIAANGPTWRVTGRSDRMKIDPDLWQALTAPDDTHDIGAAEVQFLLLPLILAEAGLPLETDIAEREITLRF